jgi:DNA-directed RNA polymerase III subunit RPC4
VSEILPKEDEPLDGVIGQLEIYKSGTVKMRLGHGIVLDVSLCECMHKSLIY